MKTISVYETNEEVLIKATVRAVVVDNGTIKYQLRNNATGIDEKYLYTEEQIFALPQNKTEKKPAPAKKVTAKKTATTRIKK